MNIKEYQPIDKDACIEIFKSNCPKYFLVEELPPFSAWLDNIASGKLAYSNSSKELYYVLEIPGNGVVACAGFYVVKDENEARFAWGMVHNSFHNKGVGTALSKYRIEKIKEINPGLTITLGTSQHTYGFFEKMGFDVKTILKDGYGENMDRYDMTLA